jgi:hypothetical protein
MNPLQDFNMFMKDFSIIVSIFALVISGYTAYMNFWYSKSKILSKKIKIVKLRFAREYGDTNDNTHGLDFFALDVENESDKNIIFIESALIFKNQHDVKYCDIHGIKRAIRPREKSDCQVFIYAPMYNGEICEYPIPPVNFNINDIKTLSNRRELDKQFKEYLETWRNVSIKRYHKAEDGFCFLIAKIKELFKTADADLIKKILKDIEVSLIFQSEDNVKCNKIYKISDKSDEFLRFKNKVDSLNIQ